MASILSTAWQLLEQSIVIPVISSALLSVITADIKKDIELKTFSDGLGRNPITYFLDTCFSYLISLCAATAILLGVYFFLVLIGFVVGSLF